MDPPVSTSRCRKEILRSPHGLWKVRNKLSEMSDEVDSTQSSESDLPMSAGSTQRNPILALDLLLKPPFFMNIQSSQPDDLVCGRCLTCKHTLVYGDSQPETLIRHLKIDHPLLYAQFEAERQKQDNRHCSTPNLPSIQYIDLNDDAEEVIDLEEDESVVTDDLACDGQQLIDADDVIVLSDGSDDEFDYDYEYDSQVDIKEVKPEISDNGSSYASSQQDSLISSAAMSQINELLNAKLTEFVTKTDFNAMAENLAVSVKSGTKRKHTDDSDSNVASELKSLKAKYRKLHSAIGAATQGKLQLQREIEDMDRRLHSRDIMFYNVPIGPSEEPSEAIEELLMSTFQLNKSVVKAVTVMKEQGYSNKFMLLVKFATDSIAQHVLRNSFLLKNTSVFIESRTSVHVQKRKRKLLRIRTELHLHAPELRVTVRGNRMNVDGKHFRWDDTEGLCLCNPSPEESTMTGAEYLKTITEVNIGEFLNELKDDTVEIE